MSKPTFVLTQDRHQKKDGELSLGVKHGNTRVFVNIKEDELHELSNLIEDYIERKEEELERKTQARKEFLKGVSDIVKNIRGKRRVWEVSIILPYGDLGEAYTASESIAREVMGRLRVLNLDKNKYNTYIDLKVHERDVYDYEVVVRGRK